MRVCGIFRNWMRELLRERAQPGTASRRNRDDALLYNRSSFSWRYRLGVRTEDSQSFSAQPNAHMSLILLLSVFDLIRWSLREWVKNRSNSSTCPVVSETLTLASQSRSQEIAARLSLPSERSQQRFFRTSVQAQSYNFASSPCGPKEKIRWLAR